MSIPQELFIPALEKSLEDLGFTCETQEIFHQWNNADYAIVVTVWNDDTVDVAGISKFTVRDIIGPLLDRLDEGEKR